MPLPWSVPPLPLVGVWLPLAEDDGLDDWALDGPPEDEPGLGEDGFEMGRSSSSLRAEPPGAPRRRERPPADADMVQVRVEEGVGWGSGKKSRVEGCSRDGRASEGATKVVSPSPPQPTPDRNPDRKMASSADKVDLSQPRYNLDTYIGRLQHFYTVTSPLTLFAPRATLLEAQTNVRKAEELIKDGGGRGVWVSPETREKYWNERQRELLPCSRQLGVVQPILSLSPTCRY